MLQTITQDHPLPRKGFASSLSASKVVTMEIVAEYQGINTDQGIWCYFHRHWLSWLPMRPTRTSFVRQAANLWQYKALMQQQRLAKQLGVRN